MASSLPHFYATSFEQASRLQLIDSRLLSNTYYADVTLLCPRGYHPSNQGSKEVCWWEINEEEQGQKNCHALTH